MHHENHEVSRTSIDSCGTNNARMCRDEWDNSGSVGQARHLTVEWTARLWQPAARRAGAQRTGAVVVECDTGRD